jgi:hypothetical protein
MFLGGWMGGWMDGWMDGWMGGWMDGWEGVKAVLMITYSNQKRAERFYENHCRGLESMKSIKKFT